MAKIVQNPMEFIKDQQKGIIDCTVLPGVCSKCGNCCSRFLEIYPKEAAKIKKWVRKNRYTPNGEEQFVGEDGKQTINMMCPFRNEKEKKCDIYDVRPFICRLFQCWSAEVIVNKDIIKEYQALENEGKGITEVDMWGLFGKTNRDARQLHRAGLLSSRTGGII